MLGEPVRFRRQLTIAICQDKAQRFEVSEAIRNVQVVEGDVEDPRIHTIKRLCERSAGTVFQLPNPDAIYSQDEGKERRWLPSHVVCVCARSTHC
jgi:hypothetical protein